MDYPLKHERLAQLAKAGFNIADFVCFPPKELNTVQLKKFFDRHIHKHGISIRNFHHDETVMFKCPVKYEVKDWKTALLFAQEQNRQFFTLANEAIPLSDARFGGNVLLLDDQNFLVEYFEGPGSPRDTERRSDLRHFQCSPGKSAPVGTPPELIRAARNFQDFLPSTRPIILEFNIYPSPIGRRKERLIVWEWRRGMLHETSELIGHLMAQVEILQVKYDTLHDLLIQKLA